MAHRKPLLVLLLCLLTVIHVAGRSLDEIRRSGKIYVAFTRDDLKNINYELAYEFARYLNVELVEVVIQWEEAFMRNGVIPPGLETNADLVFTPDALKKADIIASTFTTTDWRERLFGFARTLRSAELLVIGPDEVMPVGIEDLAGKRIAFVGNTTFEQHLEEIDSLIGGGIAMVTTESSAETKRLLEEGNVYGIVLDADEALIFNASNGQKYRIAFPISEITQTAWATEKNNSLIGEVENFFETIAGNGVLDEIFYKRFRITYSTYLDRLSKNLKLERYNRDLEEILASRKLVVALRERDFIYNEGGRKQFMHALAEEFADYLGVGLEFVVTPYFGKYWEAEGGMIYRDSSYTPEWFNYFDLACETIAPLDWRTNKVNLIPVYPSSYVVVADQSNEVRSLEDLRLLRGVTGRETIYEDILRENGITNYYYAHVDSHLQEVAAGKADYTIIYDAFYELNKYPGLEVKLELGTVEIGWALRKDQPELEDEVRRFIERSREKGLIRVLLRALRGNTLQAPEAYLHSYYASFQTGQLPYVNYGAEDGLPQEDIFSIFQDRKGYLWFGTNSGAVRYNGREMEVYHQDHGLPGNSVRDISQDSSGMMYFATTRGIARFRDDTARGILLEGLAFNEIFIDSREHKWFIGDRGLFREEADGSIRHFNSEFTSLPEVIYQVTEEPRTGNLLMATTQGVFMYDVQNQSMVRLSDTDSYSLLIDSSDSIWISTRDGLFISDLDDLLKNRQDATPGNLSRRLNIPAGIISDMTTNQNGSVWLVTDSRLMQVLSTEEKPIIYEQEIGIRNNKILSFLIDREDNIWIGFSGGLQRLTAQKGLRNFYPEIINSYIYSVFQDEYDRIWITSDNGVFYFLEDNLVNFTTQVTSGDSHFSGMLLPGGNILLAGKEGLYEVNSQSLAVERQNAFQLAEEDPETIFVTGTGEIFLLTGMEGVIYYLPDFHSEPVRLKNRFTSNIFHLIEVNGRVIGGNSSGFVVFNGSEFELLQETDFKIWSLCKDENRIWAGTDQGIGLVSNGRFDRVEISGNDMDMVIRSIIPARNRNYLWTGSYKGFSYYNTYTGETELTIGSGDGLSGEEITPGGLFLDRDGLLWVGTYHGISNFNIRAKSPAAYAPVCYIEKMYLNGEPVLPENGYAFSHRENNFVFEISALSFSDEGSLEYEYYLRGSGNERTSPQRGSGYRAIYSNLPPGNYEFIYRARGKNNIWGYAENFEFTIRKAWYNTWIFRIVVILAVFSLAYFLFTLRARTKKQPA